MRKGHAAAIAMAAAFLAAHLTFLPASLEDLDSANFALGLRRFDVARHQPHPPGYPVFIAAARLVHLVVPAEAKALGVVSGVAGALALFPLIALFARLEPDRPRRWAIVAAIVTLTAPLYYMTAARPLSDTAGLAAVVAIQALTIASTGTFVTPSFLAGLAIGIRSQIAWLTLPLLVFAIVRSGAANAGPESADGSRTRLGRRGTILVTLAAFLVGIVVWAVPLVVLTGGPSAYWRALFTQGAEDFSGIQMLWTTPTPRQALATAYYAFVAPWAIWPLAAGVLAFAAVGLLVMLRSARPALALLTAAFGPYLVFDLLFQESVTSRYALPLVVPIAYLAVRAASLVPGNAGMILALGVAGLSGTVGVVSVASYASMPAPAFRLLEDMRVAAEGRRAAPVLAMHRREDLDLRRPIEWVGAALPAFSRRLAAPPKHEWLELVKYWDAGGLSPVWFVADPMRTDVALIDRLAGRRGSYRWPLTYPVLLGGVRPDEMDWHVFDAPGWYLGEGWALTPETAGVAEEDHRGPGLAPIDGWIRRRSEPATLMVGGRNLASGGPISHVTLTLDGRAIDDIAAAPGFFLKFVPLPRTALDGAGRYARLSIAADQPQVAVEQFDAQSAGHVIFGFGDGWYEHEYNPATGRSWRWMSERGVIRARAERHGLRLTMQGETETFSRPTRVSVRVGDRLLAEGTVDRRFTVQAQIPADLVTADEAAIVVESDQFWVPAERSRRTQDRRHLSLRVYDLQLRPVS